MILSFTFGPPAHPSFHKVMSYSYFTQAFALLLNCKLIEGRVTDWTVLVLCDISTLILDSPQYNICYNHGLRRCKQVNEWMKNGLEYCVNKDTITETEMLKPKQ